MVNGVNFSGGYNNISQYSTKDIENLAKYALGTNIVTPDEGPMSGMGMMLGIGGAMEAFKGGKWAWNHKDNLKGGWQEGVEAYKTDLAAKKELFSNGGWKSAETYKNVWNNYSAKTVLEGIPEAAKMAKLEEAAKEAKEVNNAKNAIDAYKEAGKFANEAKTAKTSEAAREALKKANDALARARNFSHLNSVATEATTTWGKVSKGLGKYTGVTKLNGFMAKTATESPLMAKALKFGKGNGWFVAITGGIELLTQVIPSFTQLGAGSGTKQLVKSTAKTAASVGGWVAGMTAGAAVGSIIPGAGTVIGGAIGALCGLFGGCLGSWAATKATESIVGKNELDIAKEKQAEEMAIEAKKDPKAIQQLMAAAAQRLDQEGKESEDAKIAFGSLQKIAKLQAKNQTSGAQSQTQYAQNTAGASNPFNKDYMNEDFMAMGAGLS